MPNWCYNNLIIEGKKKDLDKFKKVLHKKETLEVLVEKKNLETYKKEILSSLKEDGSANRDMNNYIRIGTMPMEEFILQYKSLCFDKKGNACKVPNDNMLHKFHPIPYELEGTTSPSQSENDDILRKKYGATNWYDWNCSNWGTKWDVDIEINEENDCAICLAFDSAWSPPVEWLNKVSKDYPKLKFILEYEEGGCAFKGILEICVDDDMFDDSCCEWFGDCGECGKDYTNEGQCDCVDENDKPFVWGEESEKDEEDNPCAV